MTAPRTLFVALSVTNPLMPSKNGVPFMKVIMPANENVMPDSLPTEFKHFVPEFRRVLAQALRRAAIDGSCYAATEWGIGISAGLENMQS